MLGVGEQVVKNRLTEEFVTPLYDFINTNLLLLSEQEGIDREGYILRMGIILAKLDIATPKPIAEYNTFFQVLKDYLEATEKDYDHMLEHSRKTELWIIEDNSQATPNCIDFCSLLYKPFEFLLTSLK
jgi:aminoglycoside/choline kinase family phosphotransferase